MQVVLVHPEIPHNTGCAARLCAALNVRLHLVEPLGFSLSDRYLKRAGLDYWPMVDLVRHESLEACLVALDQDNERPLQERLRLFSARGGRSCFQTEFFADDLLLFGSETKGLPADFLASNEDRRVYLPIQAGIRSLNLANTIAVGLYTALDRAGIALPENDGSYAPHPDALKDVWPQDVVRDSGVNGLPGC
ncbi:MAG TPA: tRNA (cytidine(34)-2'-O)-methyltransferase [Planctomycetes bacterium]|nr:tRNA (cytidine(34)-2'-O)-methyltransferase [Planctomycetota bacterium]HIL37626.1 tRNA (cytidine(34)-2'-O)-methyltransferase [Planctomycetota bacterium]